MVVFEYVLITLIYSVPWLIVAIGCMWIFLKRRNYSSKMALFICVVATLNFLILSQVVWWVWPTSTDGPMLFPFGLGPALVAAVIVFPATIWWYRSNAT